MNKGYSIYFDRETYQLISKLAQDLSCSKSDAVRICIRKTLKTDTKII